MFAQILFVISFAGKHSVKMMSNQAFTKYVLCIILYSLLDFGLNASSLDNLLKVKRSTEVKSRTKRLVSDSLSDIEKGQFPYLAHLKGKVPTHSFWGIPYRYRVLNCGATILNKRWVLSAAHCVEEADLKKAKEPKYWHITAGEVKKHTHWYNSFFHEVGKMLGVEKLQTWTLHATQIVVHPNYDPSNLWRNDVALFKLEDDLPIGDIDYISEVPLPTSESNWPAKGDNCIMTGWGCSESGGSTVDHAVTDNFTYVDDSQCKRTFSGIDTKTQFCAHKSAGLCSGDSGGPLVCKKGDTYQLAGVASFAMTYNPEDNPSGFTRVSYYIDFIKKYINL